MRVARFSVSGHDPQYGLVELAADGGPHPDTVAAISGDPLATSVRFTGERFALSEVRLLAPVIPRSKVVCVGRNYAAHAAELGHDLPSPEAPLTFFKPNTSVIGPEDSIVHPAETNDLQWEGELAVVIGRICKEVPVERAQEVIFGYTVANDVTSRDLQKSDGQWSRAKGADTFCPLGPWIVAHLSLEEAGSLRLTTRLNGEVKQQSSTSHMERSIAELIAHVSSWTTLLPGDVLLTGTPEGVGRMVPGDTVSVEIERIGTLSNPVVAADASSATSSTPVE